MGELEAIGYLVFLDQAYYATVPNVVFSSNKVAVVRMLIIPRDLVSDVPYYC